MADIKIYNGSTWNNTAVRKYETKSEIITPPTTIYADGTSISTYTIKGNAVQSGTPTPSNPVAVTGVGNKTANLFDYQDTTGINDNYYINQSAAIVSNSSYYISPPIKVSANTDYTWQFGGTNQHSAPTVGFYDNNDTIISAAQHINAVTYFTFTTPSNCAYVRASVYKTSKNESMLSKTDDVIPYEPYGYKIPISSGQASAVNYLGNVQSTRQIKKLVLTGEETVAGSAVTGGWIITNLSDSINNTAGVQTAYCSHYEAKENGAMSGLSNGEMCISTQYNNRINFVTSFSSATDFQAYLAQQYANGTPVTVWYVLATPQTAVVNEPLMKIGDYADSISNAIAIPTTDGANTITVDTTVQPSEFTATWTGWHNAEVKEYDGTDWQ